jgi:hypothetical protein
LLTDIFANRYREPTWSEVDASVERLIVQGFRILSEQICPYYYNGKETERGKTFWTNLQSRLSMELGLKSLAALGYAYPSTYQGQQITVSGTWAMVTVCENWMLEKYDGRVPPDRFIKERISLIELGFRLRETEIAALNAKLPEEMERADKGRRLNRSLPVMPGRPSEGLKAQNAIINSQFRSCVDELNTRFRQAGCNLTYHNGLIQRSGDQVIADHIESPAWQLVSDPKWTNVDTDLKEAIDRRDNDGRDPAFYAAKALESAIKVISAEKGWTSGTERGAANFVDNLRAGRFVEVWEAESLKLFFGKVRNPFGHGPGSEPMPKLTMEQTDWAIETSMVWIKSLVQRL